MDYYKIRFSGSKNEAMRDILTYELGEIGFESFDEDGDYFNAYVQQNTFDESKLAEICNVYREQFDLAHTIELIPTQNWNAKWESNYEPIEIEKILRIRANFHAPVNGFEHEIIIIPKMSFGTGHHETTQLVARAMHPLDFKNKTILDMGCGTGILAIYAAKLGAETIHAIDIEDFAYENTLENVRINGQNQIHVEKGGIEKIPPVDFNIILANINKNILLQQMPTYAHHLTKNGSLLLSGFFDNDCDELLKIGLHTGMKFVSKEIRNNWTCLHLQKN